MNGSNQIYGAGSSNGKYYEMRGINVYSLSSNEEIEQDIGEVTLLFSVNNVIEDSNRFINIDSFGEITFLEEGVYNIKCNLGLEAATATPWTGDYTYFSRLYYNRLATALSSDVDRVIASGAEDDGSTVLIHNHNYTGFFFKNDVIRVMITNTGQAVPALSFNVIASASSLIICKIF